jgi:hypothetical protein
VAALQLAGTWLVMAHSPGSGEVTLLVQALVLPLVLGALAWLLYIGLEPYVRRTWPSSLISWNRIVDGRFRDPRVARDILIGLATTAVLDSLDPLLAKVAQVPPRGLNERLWIAASSLHDSVGAAMLNVTEISLVALVLLIILCLVRMVLRRDAVVTVVFAGVVGLIIAAGYAAAFRAPLGAIFLVAYGAMYGAAWAVLLVRFGLIAFMAHQVSDALISNVVTIDPTVWYAGSSILNLAAIAALTAYAAWVCLAARAPRTIQ